MRRVLIAAALIAALASAAVAGAGPISKQNGSTPLFKDFTSICAVPGYAFYGFCDGSTTKFADVTGRINAVQPKAGVWNLGVSFTHLQPGALYRLWGNRQGSTPLAGEISGFFVADTALAGLDGTVRFSYQTTNPTNLGFDLNFLASPDQFNGTTIATSYWSTQWIQVLNADGTLYVPTA